MAKVLIPIATGFEEIEAVSIIDVLRRGGIEVIIAGIDSESNNNLIKGANNIVIETNLDIKNILNISSFDMIVLPGGWGGTTILSQNIQVQNLIKEFDVTKKLIGAICAAPFALSKAGVLKDNLKFTCYPSVEEQIPNSSTRYIDNFKVIQSENIITSRGPGTAICFGLYIVSILISNEVKNSLKKGLLADFCD